MDHQLDAGDEREITEHCRMMCAHAAPGGSRRLYDAFARPADAAAPAERERRLARLGPPSGWGITAR